MNIKNFLTALIVMMFIFSGNVYAMNFSQPVKIGCIGHYFQSPYEGLPIGGESYNSGKPHTERSGLGNAKTYEVGIARFGNDSDALYCYYNYQDDSIKFGGKDNHVLSTGKGYSEIYKIDSDEGLTLYVIDTTRFGGFNIVGRQKNGDWFSYVDGKLITDKFFNGKMAYNAIGGVLYGKVKVKDDTIIIPYWYQLDEGIEQYKGELRFKWDDAAQCFDIEKIVYNS